MDVGLAGGNDRGDLRQRTGLVLRVHRDDARIIALLAPDDVPAHVDPGDVGIVKFDQGLGLNGVDHDRRVGLEDAHEAITGHDTLG